MLFQHQLSRPDHAEEAIHGQMELRIIILHSLQEIFHFDLNIQLFLNLPHKRFLRRLPRLDLPARKFPAVLELAISPLCRKDFILMYNNRRHYLHCLHVIPPSVVYNIFVNVFPDWRILFSFKAYGSPCIPFFHSI